MTLPNKGTLELHPKNSTRQAIFIGLLTFAVTPLIALIVVVPLLLLGKLSESFNPIIIVAKTFELQDLGGFFNAQFIFMGFLALSGNFAAAIISWRASHSKKLATITFFSALIFQVVALGIVLPLTVKQSQRIMKAGIAHEHSFAQYATVGEASYKVQGRYSDEEITNLYPHYGPIYRTLEISVPIAVSRQGSYRITVEYAFSKEDARGNTRQKSVTRTFDINEHTVNFEFLANESGGNYGYWSPPSVGGKIQVQLDFFPPRTGVFSKKQTVAKFVGTKQTQF